MFVETDDVVIHRDPQGPAIGSQAHLKEKLRDKYLEQQRQEQIDHIVDEVLLNPKHLYSDFIEESFETADRVRAILADRDDDKLGRIQDLYADTAKSFAVWLVDSGNDSCTIPLKQKLGLI